MFKLYIVHSVLSVGDPVRTGS